MGEITLEFLQNLLKEEHPDVVIQSFEGAPGSKRGDNYTSMVYRITLKGIQKNIEPDGTYIKETPWESSIIHKCLPESITRRDMYKSEELFCNEVAFYNKIWPAMCSFQKRWEKVKRPFVQIPKCYLARNDCVVLKDLKRQGFSMLDRRQSLTIEQAYVVLKHLAQFHAISLAMKCYDPEGFFKLINKDGINEVLFISENDDYYKAYYHEAIDNAITMVEEELKYLPEKDVYLNKFKEFCNEKTFFQTMVDLVTPQEPLAVVCHGDCWTNNFMFRYVDGEIAEEIQIKVKHHLLDLESKMLSCKSNGMRHDRENPVGYVSGSIIVFKLMYLVDFQLVRYASPAADLVYMIYLCMDRQQRAEHQTSLLQYYADELHGRLAEMSEKKTMIHSELLDRHVLYELIQEEFRRCGKLGLGMAIDMYPIMMCDSNEAPNLYTSADNDSKPESSSVQPVHTSNATCRKKMTDLVQELVDGGLL